jgi:hypothetical protein
MADCTSESLRLLESAQQMDAADHEGQQMNKQLSEPNRWQKWREKLSQLFNSRTQLSPKFASRREFLHQSTQLVAGAAVLHKVPFLDRHSSPTRQFDIKVAAEQNPPLEKTGFQPDYFLSQSNIDVLSSLGSDEDLGSNPKRQKEKEATYFNVEASNLRTLAKLLTPEALKNHLNPLGPYGQLLFELIYLTPADAYQVFEQMKKGPTYQQIEPALSLAEKGKSFAEIIGLPLEVLFSLMLAKSLNESQWNHLSKVEESKKYKIGIGLFQQELNKAQSNFPDRLDLLTAKQQIIYELGKIASTAALVRSRKGSFTFADLEYYYVGQAFNEPDSKYGKAWKVARVNFKRIIRNVAMGDPTGQDLVKLLNIWQNGDNEYQIWSPKGNGGDQALSRENFELIFQSLLEKNAKVTFVRARGKTPETIPVVDKTQYVALYLRLKYGGKTLPVALPKNELLGFSEENYYFALAYIGFKVVPYKEYSDRNKLIKQSASYNLVDFLDRSEDYEKRIPPLFTATAPKPPIIAEQPSHPAASKNDSAERPAHPRTEKMASDLNVGPELQPGR